MFEKDHIAYTGLSYLNLGRYTRSALPHVVSDPADVSSSLYLKHRESLSTAEKGASNSKLLSFIRPRDMPPVLVCCLVLTSSNIAPVSKNKSLHRLKYGGGLATIS